MVIGDAESLLKLCEAGTMRTGSIRFLVVDEVHAVLLMLCLLLYCALSPSAFSSSMWCMVLCVYMLYEKEQVIP